MPKSKGFLISKNVLRQSNLCPFVKNKYQKKQMIMSSYLYMEFFFKFFLKPADKDYRKYK